MNTENKTNTVEASIEATTPEQSKQALKTALYRLCQSSSSKVMLSRTFAAKSLKASNSKIECYRLASVMLDVLDGTATSASVETTKGIDYAPIKDASLEGVLLACVTAMHKDM